MSVLSQAELDEKLQAWAQHIITRLQPGDGLALVGIMSHGDVLARRLVSALEAVGRSARYGALDISLYRDDFDMKSCKLPLRSSYLPFSTDGLTIILVDDVIHTGRTVRAALNALFEYGRPARVELHCLVDRGGRELPIQPDYAACLLSSSSDVSVHLLELDGQDEVIY